MKIIYCQSTWREDFEDTKLCVERVSPNVDATIIAFDDTLTEEQIQWLMINTEKYNLHPVRFKFEDDMPAMRNVYLEEAKRLGAGWVCVSDPDELYSEALAENLRRLIEEYDPQGYNLLPPPVRDQFEAPEWADDLDKLKEIPEGYRDPDFWKPLLIFKVYPDTHYEGVGIERNVHETLRSSTPLRPKNLPKEYYYTHRKSALRIWRNAARNMFIGGGGDNVGRLNRYWVNLREVCAKLGVRKWLDFEELMKRGVDDREFKGWLLSALQAQPTNWGVETRQTAKWYYALHPEEIGLEIRNHLENPPVITPEIEAENFVTRCYFEVLGRPPDPGGLRLYVGQILSGAIRSEDLPGILRQSQEFRQRVPTGPVEHVRMQVPVDVSVRISEGLFLEALQRSKMYWETIKPKMDVGGLIMGALCRKKEFLGWFYANQEDLTLQDLLEWLSANVPKPDSVSLCIMGYHQVLPMIIESIRIMEPHGIDEIHVQGDDFTKDDVKLLESYGANVHIEPWVDEFSDYKNKCVEPANTEWVLILDHDEIPTEDFAENLRKVIKQSKRGKSFNIVQFDVIDVKTRDGKPVAEHHTPKGKPLLHWNVPEPYYGNPHIWLKPNYYPWKQVHVPYAYRHVKELGVELPNSVRNVFLGGGGDNARERNPLWVELRALTKELGVDTWKEFHGYLKGGDVDPRLLDVLKRLSEMPWKDDELKDPLRYYQKIHHEGEGRAKRRPS